MRKTGQFLAKLWNDESGLTATEYGLMLALLGAAIVIGADALGDAIGNELSAAAECIDGNGTTACDSL